MTRPPLTAVLALGLLGLAVVAPGCAGRGRRASVSTCSPSYAAVEPVATVDYVAEARAMAGAAAIGGEDALRGLPWAPDVFRVNLAARGPVAITRIYIMTDDFIAVDTTGKIYCLSRRDLMPKWVSSLRAPLAAPIAESPIHYVCLEKDAMGASWIEWFSKRSGAAADASPVRLPYSASSGISATAGTAFVGSFGSPLDNKTLESTNLADGTPGWGYRTDGRIVATPTLDPSGEILLVACEDKTFTSLPSRQSGPTAVTNWVSMTTGANSVAPAVTRDWAFLGSDDNFLRCYDIHGGGVLWMRGLDAPIRRSPWTLGSSVSKVVAAGGEGSPKLSVEQFEGFVFAQNATGLHCFVAGTGEPVFTDTNADRPLVKQGDWVLTLGDGKVAQVRKGAGLPVVKTHNLGMFDFLPTNPHDGQIVAGFSNGTVLLATPK